MFERSGHGEVLGILKYAGCDCREGAGPVVCCLVMAMLRSISCFRVWLLAYVTIPEQGATFSRGRGFVE